MARITDEKVLMERVVKMLPKGIPASAIQSVECDPYDGSNGGGSYWVYLADGYWNPTMGCHTIHEDTLAELKPYLREVEVWADDPALEDPSKGYGATEATKIVREQAAATEEPETTNPFPVITEEIQTKFEEQGADCTRIPMICGCSGRACRQMGKAEGANRAICQGCPLAEFAAAQGTEEPTEENEKAEEAAAMYETRAEALALYRSIRHMPTRYAIYNELTGETLEGPAKVLNRAILTTEAVMGDSSFIPARADYLQGSNPTRREVETWAIIEAAYSHIGMF